MKIDKIKTLGDLIKSGYVSKGIKDELRDNLRKYIKAGTPVFEGTRVPVTILFDYLEDDKLNDFLEAETREQEKHKEVAIDWIDEVSE